MTLTHLLPTMLFVAATACLSSSNTIPRLSPTSSEQSQAAESVRLSGFVELYANEGVQLLSEGKEITLSGATELAVPMGGLEVVVSGRFVDGEVFWVDSVVRVPSEVLAVTTATR